MASKLNPDPTPAASERGQQIVRPGFRDLFLDLDGQADYDFLVDRLDHMSGVALNLEVVHIGPSRSGKPHLHVYLRASRDLSDIERIALQACLGSDRVREFLSLMRIWEGGEGTTFFENPDWKDPR